MSVRISTKINLMKKIQCVAVLLVVTFFAAAQQPTPVRVEQGVLQGVNQNGLTVYKGIPFAAPPVGNLRWCAPQPAPSWTGVKQAGEFAPAPMQGGTPPSGKDEDCLYLNIWTPAKSASEKIPVLVWIYG